MVDYDLTTMPFKQFDRSRLRLRPLGERQHDLDISSTLSLDDTPPAFEDANLPIVADRIVQAREEGRPVVVMMGGHVPRSGVAPHLIDLMERGLCTHIAMNGGAAIHDFEMALVGATTESVARYVRSGEFGLWEETGQLNDLAVEASNEGIGFGEAIGRRIANGGLAHADGSLLASAHRLGIPATVHVGIGYDIVHEHPGCDGAAVGAASYADFLVFAETITELEGGVILNFGSAVMGPEVFLKALAMARNVAHQQDEVIQSFTTAVFDIVDLGSETDVEAPKDSPRYYFRPFKTMLVRTVVDGGESFYVRGPHRATISNLHRLVLSRAETS